ncbi:MAG: hypothetical protein NC342_07060, partial [Pseudoflavonifractor sp.]|nr:hypothetical protein [Pseudoflavonifractor sp.]
MNHLLPAAIAAILVSILKGCSHSYDPRLVMAADTIDASPAIALEVLAAPRLSSLCDFFPMADKSQ